MCLLGSPANKRCVILRAGMVATVTKKQIFFRWLSFNQGFSSFFFLVTAANTNWQNVCHLGSPANKRCAILIAGMVATVTIACSSRSDSGARAKNKASEREGKNEGRLGKRTSSSPVSPRFFPAYACACIASECQGLPLTCRWPSLVLHAPEYRPLSPPVPPNPVSLPCLSSSPL